MKPDFQPFTLRSGAKVNLYLRVGPRRPDGFHPLVSWFCSVGLADELAFAPGKGRGVTLRCDHADVPCDDRNLVLKAADALGGHGFPAVCVHLRKRIPMGGGLGGGSSNAAAALVGFQRAWGIALPADQQMHVAAQLGSDVPFFLHAPSAICRGRGEQVTPIAPPRAQAAVLLLPAISMPTPAVYRRFDEMGLGTDLEGIEPALPDPALPTAELLKVLVNDLEPPAFDISPELAQIRARAEQAAGRPVRMSGSGSTLFTLYDHEAEAARAAADMEQSVKVCAIPCAVGS